MIKLTALYDTPADRIRRNMAFNAEFKRLMLSTVIFQEPAVPKPRRFRDALTGLFTSKKKAEANPGGHVAESPRPPSVTDLQLAFNADVLAKWHSDYAHSCLNSLEAGNVAAYEYHYRAAVDLDRIATHLRKPR